MSKLRIKSSYGVTPNNVLTSTELTFKAKGLFGYLQSKPSGWDFSSLRITYETKDGRDAIQAGLRELEETGYLQRIKGKNELGQWDWEYILSETPIKAKPVTDYPVQEKALIKKEVSNKEINSNKEILLAEKNFGVESDEIQIVDSDDDGWSPPVKKINPGNLLITWAEQKMGKRFVNIPLQLKSIKSMTSAGYTEEDIKKKWEHMESTSFWGENGIDFKVVAGQISKKTSAPLKVIVI